MEKAKRVGRPTKAPKAGERVSLGLRVTADTKRKLDASAAISGRSQSQEAELRLEQSFRDEADAGGPAMQQIVRLMTSAFYIAGHATSGGKDPAEWLRDPAVYANAVFAVVRALNAGKAPTTASESEIMAAMIHHMKTPTGLGLDKTHGREGGEETRGREAQQSDPAGQEE